MAHEISTQTINGQTIVEAMYANQPAWHGLGEVFAPDGQQAPDSETAMRLAHLDWRVEKENLCLASDHRAVSSYYGLVRQDTRETLSVVGNEYQVLQNSESFAFLDSLLQDGIMRYESAMALKGGRCICLLARMPSVDFVTKEDAILRYVMLSAYHGGGGIQVAPTATRVVCANTQRIALDNATRSGRLLTIRHSGDIASKLRIAQNYLSQFDAAFTLYNQQASSLLKGYTPAQAKAYIAELFPAPDAKAGDRTINNHARRVQQVRDAFRSPAQQLPTVKGTWWALFNSVTETVDHAAPTRQAKDIIARRENRFISTMSGEGADFKDRAFELALSMAG